MTPSADGQSGGLGAEEDIDEQAEGEDDLPPEAAADDVFFGGWLYRDRTRRRLATLAHGAATTAFTILDITGVHEILVRWCRCPGAESQHTQLIQNGLYPATRSRPRTACTFRVLDDFLLTNRESGTTAMSYYAKLERLTNPLFPKDVPVGPPIIVDVTIFNLPSVRTGI